MRKAIGYLESVAKFTMIMAATAGLAAVVGADDGEALLNSQPPVVLRTFPVSGYGKVDPETTELKIVFNKKMAPGSWSFVQLDKKTFPQLVGSPSYDTKLHICTAKVRLKPSTTYVIWLNKGSFMNFKDANGRSAVPYLLTFRTAGKEYVAKKHAAIKVANEWLALLDAAKFAETWKMADKFFATRISKNKWVEQMTMLSRKLGKPRSRKLRSAILKTRLPDIPDSIAFILRFDTNYAHKPNSIETIVPVRGTDGEWRVSGYFIK